MHRCEATSLKGFVQQIACVYLRHGYHWFVQGRIREDKDPATVDAKLLAKYGIDIADATRWRRKKLGKANMQYLRFGRDFVLMATKGRHAFYDIESKSIRWAGKNSIKLCGYSISYRPGGRTRKGERDPRWHSHVQIEWSHYKELKAMFVGLCCRRSVEQMARLFYELPFEPYAPVRRQIGSIWKEVNRTRKYRRLPPIPVEVLPFKTKSVRVYESNVTKQLWSKDGGWWYEVRLSPASP